MFWFVIRGSSFVTLGFSPKQSSIDNHQ